MTMTLGYFVSTLAIAFLLGGCVGALVMYLWSERELNTLYKYNNSLEEKNRQLSNDLEDCKKSHSILDLIDDVPEYLRDKYDIPGQSALKNFSDSDEDFSEVYI